MFSIVVPIYNNAHTIRRTLNSVLLQTFQKFEIIIVNDGSTDDCVDVINRFTRDTRVRIIDQENKGVSAARNKGIASANYDLIALLDGDDEWLPEFLERMKEAIDAFPHAGMYGCPSWHRDLLTGEGEEATLERYKGRIQQVEYFENPHTMPHTSAMVLSRKAFYSVFPDGQGFPVGMKVCEDWSCFYRIAFLYPMVYVGMPLGIRNNNVRGQITGVAGEERFQHLKHVVNFYNLTYRSASMTKKKLFIRFLRYDLRHRFLNMIRENNWRSLEYFEVSLDDAIKDELRIGELLLYRVRVLRPLSAMCIYITKLIWRTHRYPIAGVRK